MPLTKHALNPGCAKPVWHHFCTVPYSVLNPGCTEMGLYWDCAVQMAEAISADLCFWPVGWTLGPIVLIHLSIGSSLSMCLLNGPAQHIYFFYNSKINYIQKGKTQKNNIPKPPLEGDRKNKKVSKGIRKCLKRHEKESPQPRYRNYQILIHHTKFLLLI